MLTGNNGIINMSKETVKATRVAEIQEAIHLELMNLDIDENKNHVEYTKEQKSAKVKTELEKKGYTEASGKVKYVANDSYIQVEDKIISLTTAKEISINESDEWDWVAKDSTKKEVMICGYKGTKTEIEIPEIILYNNEIYTVIGLENCGSSDEGHNSHIVHSTLTTSNHRFVGNTIVKKIHVLSNVKSIGSGLFKENTTLEEFTIEDGLTNFERPGQTGLSSIFLNCTSLKKCKLSSKITSIPNYMFSGCEKLVDVEIPNQTETIGLRAFANCKSITSIVIPNTVTSISEYAFSKCTSVKNIVIGTGVTEIGECAFKDLNSVVSDIHLPSSLTLDNIGKNAFNHDKTIASYKVYLSSGVELNTDWVD